MPWSLGVLCLGIHNTVAALIAPGIHDGINHGEYTLNIIPDTLHATTLLLLAATAALL